MVNMMKTDKEYKELSIKEFNKATEKYESGNAGIYEMCKRDYPPILEEIRKTEFETLLDAGCGTAPMISLLQEEYNNKKYTGIDLSPKMIEKAKMKNLPNTEFIVGDCEFTWFANKVELPLANLTGHGDVKMHTLEEVRGYCKKANLKVEKLEQQSRFRMHLVAVKE